MHVSLDFYYDFGSPTAYLAYKRLQQLKDAHALDISYHPMLLGGVFKATSNSSPITIPAKGKYMLEHDLPRFATRYGVSLNMNPHFPINTLNLMRGAIAAARLDCEAAYIACMFDGVWLEARNLGETEVVREVLLSTGLDAAAIMELSQQADTKQALIDATDAAVARGCFGAPTMFIGDEMFFGQDRLDFIEERLS